MIIIDNDFTPFICQLSAISFDFAGPHFRSNDGEGVLETRFPLRLGTPVDIHEPHTLIEGIIFCDETIVLLE